MYMFYSGTNYHEACGLFYTRSERWQPDPGPSHLRAHPADALANTKPGPITDPVADLGPGHFRAHPVADTITYTIANSTPNSVAIPVAGHLRATPSPDPINNTVPVPIISYANPDIVTDTVADPVADPSPGNLRAHSGPNPGPDHVRAHPSPDPSCDHLRAKPCANISTHTDADRSPLNSICKADRGPIDFVCKSDCGPRMDVRPYPRWAQPTAKRATTTTLQLGRITIALTHDARSARCMQFSGTQYSGGCKVQYRDVLRHTLLQFVRRKLLPRGRSRPATLEVCLVRSAASTGGNCCSNSMLVGF